MMITSTRYAIINMSQEKETTIISTLLFHQYTFLFEEVTYVNLANAWDISSSKFQDLTIKNSNLHVLFS